MLETLIAQTKESELAQVAFIAFTGLIVFGIIAIQRWLAVRRGTRETALPVEPNPNEMGLWAWILLHTPLLVFIPLQLAGFGLGFFLGEEYWLLLRLAALGTLWLLVAYFSRRIRDPFWSNSAAVAGYLISGTVLLPEILELFIDLEAFNLRIGALSISLFHIAKGIAVLLIALWAGWAVSKIAQTRIDNARSFSPSLKVLIVKILRIVLLVLAFLAAVDAMGINVTALTVLGGGLGLGLGFGLQKVVGNLVSGFILLMDRSIKPGDVIEIDDTYGWINNLRARYVSVITRDGKEHLIPNEDLITQRVINWSHSDQFVRVRLSFGVSYKSDPHQVQKLALETVFKSPRVLNHPEPRCFLVGFGDSSLDFELRYWIRDPQEGITNMKSEIYFALWDIFKENDIEIPFPQRDLHLRSPDHLRVDLSRPRDDS